jgi:hypothetical protein
MKAATFTSDITLHDLFIVANYRHIASHKTYLIDINRKIIIGL